MITLISGGARSGKSTFAEKLLDTDDVCYIATAVNDGLEMQERIKKHRESRNQNWRTFEAYDKKLVDALGDENNYILECLTVYISNLYYKYGKDEDITPEIAQKVEEHAINELKNFFEKIKSEDKNLILVTNELGMGLVPMDRLSRYYRDSVGRINQKIASMADNVYVVFLGMELKLK